MLSIMLFETEYLESIVSSNHTYYSIAYMKQIFEYSPIFISIHLSSYICRLTRSQSFVDYFLVVGIVFKIKNLVRVV